MHSDSESSSELSCDFDDDGLKADLESYVDDVENSGSFALFKPANHAPNPGLYVQGAGIIGLPLSDRDASAVVAASHQAPFGKGSQTVVDVSVRKTWELSTGEFQIRNPAWDAFVNSIVGEVEAGLGVAKWKGVSAQLYKLLLYDEGGMFKPHQDSEKAPRMFGTLVIALPSSHQGGEVIVSHAGKTKTLSTSPQSEFDVSWMAWYSDVTHEVLPVTAGRRLVLTYNLVHTTETIKASAQDSFRQLQGLQRVLKSWDKKAHAGVTLRRGLAYILEHKYSEANIRFENLKGRDQQIVSLLRDAAEDGQHCICLANIERQISGECEEDYDDDYYGHNGDYGDHSQKRHHEMTEEVERSLKCSVVVDLDGGLITKDFDIDDEVFVQEDPFKYEDPDEEDYEGYTGNAGASATHHYRRTVVLIVPRHARLGYFTLPLGFDRINDSSRVMFLFKKLRSEFDNASDELLQLLRTEIKTLWNKVMSIHFKWKGTVATFRRAEEKIIRPFTREVFETMWQVALNVLKDKNSIESVWSFCGRDKGNRYFELGCAIWQYDLIALLPLLYHEVSTMKTFSKRLNALRDLTSALSHMKAEAAMNNAPKFQAADDVTRWIKDQAWVALNTLPLETTENGNELLDIQWLEADREMFSQRIIPAVRRNISNVPMVTQFLCRLIEQPSASLLNVSEVSAIVKELLADFSEGLKLQPDHYWPPRTDPTTMEIGGFSILLPTASPLSKLVANVEQAQSLAIVLCQYQTLGMSDELQKTLTKLSEQARILPISCFDVILLPTLKATLAHLEKCKLQISSSSPLASLFQSVLASYICRCIANPPTTPTDWTLPARGCSADCRDCRALDIFLRDPQKVVGRFPMGSKRRAHLRWCLDHTACTNHELLSTPQTLVVTKTRTGFIAKLAAYKERSEHVVKNISDLGLEKIRDLLGDYFSDIIAGRANLSLKRLHAGSPALARTSGNIGRPSAEHVLPPISRRKIPGGGTISVYDSSSGDVEVIDITSDLEGS